MDLPSVQRVIVPTAMASTGAQLPDNPELRKIAYDVLAAVKYAFYAHAVDPGRPARDSNVDQVLADAIRSMPEERQHHYRDLARELLAAGPAARRGTFGRYASTEPDSVRRLGVRGMREQLGPVEIDPRLLGLPRTEGGPVRQDKLESIWGVVEAYPLLPQPHDPAVVYRMPPPPPGDPSIPFPGYYKTLQFVVHALHCIDECNLPGMPEWGTDEIGIGGVTVSFDGTTTKVGEHVYTDFDDGDYEWFPLAKGGWKFGVYDRPAPVSGGVLYDTYGVVVALAEKGGGGFQDALTDLWAEVKDEVEAAIAASVTAGTLPVLGPFAPVAGAIAAWVVDELVNLIISTFEDRMFPPKWTQLTTPRGFTIPGPGSTYEAGGFRTEEQKLQFYGYGGHYEVLYFWRLTDWIPGAGSQ